MGCMIHQVLLVLGDLLVLQFLVYRKCNYCLNKAPLGNVDLERHQVSVSHYFLSSVRQDSLDYLDFEFF